MTSAATQQITDGFSTVLSQVPEGVNPFPFLREGVYGMVHPTPSEGFKYHLWVLSGIFVLPPVFFLGGLFVRWRRGDVWFFRWEKLSGRRFLLPHYMTPWALTLLLSAGICQGFIWSTYRSTLKDNFPNDSVLWRTLPWLGPLVGFTIPTTALLGAHALYLETTSQPRPIYLSAPFLNIFTAAVPLLMFSVVVPLAVLSSNYYNSGVQNYIRVDMTLQKLEASWDGTIPAAALQGVTAMGIKFVMEFDQAISYFKWTFVCHCGAGVFIQASFIGAAFLHLRALNRSLEGLREATKELPPQFDGVRKRYRVLILVTVLMSILTSLFVAACLFTAVDSRRIVTTGAGQEAACLLALYAFVVPLLVISVYTFLRSFDLTSTATSKPATQRLISATAIPTTATTNLNDWPTLTQTPQFFTDLPEIMAPYYSYPSHPSPSATEDSAASTSNQKMIFFWQ